VFAAGVVIAFIAPDPLQWLGGFWAGGAATAYLALREAPPEFVARWRRGAEGERATARVLARLRREGWELFHDLDTGRGNRDHIAVGPGGVYLLDSKSLSGTIAIDGDMIRVSYRDYPQDGYSVDTIGPWMRGQAAQLKSEIQSVTGRRPWVQAVVVVWGRFERRQVDGDRVIFIHGDDIADWLRRQPERLTPTARETIAAALRPS
jgi:hypothetical protein